MKKIKKIVSVLTVALILLSFNALFASAKSSSPISLSVSTSSDSVNSYGIVNVVVKVENISDKAVKNIVVTSSDSTGVAYFKTSAYNVLISDGAKFDIVKDSMTSSLNPGGKLIYSYCVVQSYQSASARLNQLESTVMRMQHIALNTKNFMDVDIKGSCVSDTKKLSFGDFKASLSVKAYYNLSDASYSDIGAAENTGLVENVGSAVKKIATGSVITTVIGSNSSKQNYVLNTNTHKFHYPTCSHVEEIYTQNRKDVYMSRNAIIKDGYEPCKDCNP